ncbi:MAG TPA: error-prone DNA polymerase, partial [Bdellovibrio sp.]|nr:error-prone DNA polymerase [Bdellovibrio sp.]
CQFAEQRGILYQGRGSAANSVVCYCLGLTSVNPNSIDLLFERFISAERREPPDIDIDFEHCRREEVIQHIYEKYDERHSAMVCTVVRYRARMATRETAKVFGIPLPKINAMIKFMGRDGMKRLRDDPSVIERFGLPADQWNLFLQMAQQVHGFPRHLGIHTGGFLITQDSITEMVPVEKATMNGRYVIQWNKDDVATLGLMKIDVLSLGMLTCLRKCFELLKNHKGVNLNLASIPHDDKDTYDMICRAETVGVFQIESRAQMNTLPRMKPRHFYDLVVEVAIVRPGPLQGGMVHPYLKRRQGREKITYASPLLEPILKKTHGVPIFQEQVMKIVIAAAGFTPGESDELRRIMSSAWRKRSTMEAIRERILRGFESNGISREYGEQIYKTIEGFA